MQSFMLVCYSRSELGAGGGDLGGSEGGVMRGGCWEVGGVWLRGSGFEGMVG